MYIRQILIAIDQLASALLGGMADETISARLYRTNSKLVPFVDFVLGKNHCHKSYISEVERKQFPKDYRE